MNRQELRAFFKFPVLGHCFFHLIQKVAESSVLLVIKLSEELILAIFEIQMFLLRT